MKLAIVLGLVMLLPFCNIAQNSSGLVVHPITSLTSSDYSDLHFLKEDLKEKKYVFLGEFSHGLHEFQQVKVRLIKYLHEEMGYNLIAIEDYLDLYSAQDKLTDTALLLSATSHSAWQGEEMIELMKYINANPELRPPPPLASRECKLHPASRHSSYPYTYVSKIPHFLNNSYIHTQLVMPSL